MEKETTIKGSLKLRSKNQTIFRDDSAKYVLPQGLAQLPRHVFHRDFVEGWERMYSPPLFADEDTLSLSDYNYGKLFGAVDRFFGLTLDPTVLFENSGDRVKLAYLCARVYDSIGQIARGDGNIPIIAGSVLIVKLRG